MDILYLLVFHLDAHKHGPKPTSLSSIFYYYYYNLI